MEKSLQLLSLQGLQVSQVASELVGVEDIRHSCLKTWKLSGELQALVSYLREVHDLLAEKIIQRGLDTDRSAPSVLGAFGYLRDAAQ